jgi:hypothetical protein
MQYGFIGYALYASANAEIIELWPPNYPPEISHITPGNGEMDVSISLSELQFEISDFNGDRMSYTVTTTPDIGSGSGNLKPDGVYSVSISGLEDLTEYSWHIEVTDGMDTTVDDFIFTTEANAPIVSNPDPYDDERYVPLSLSDLSFHLKDFQGDPIDYTVETSPDIGSDSGNNVGEGTYTIPVSGLDYSREYTWYVNASDGEHESRKVFNFQTEHKITFNPFNEGWKYRKKITIDHNKVDENLENFPVLISTTDVDLRDKAQDDGDDIIFMDGVGVAKRLYHEIEQYEDSSGELIAWVNVNDLYSNQDTNLYMYYGNPNAGEQQAPEFVWDSNFQAVWHLNEEGVGLRYDSTFNSFDGTPYSYDGNEATTGQIDGADDFDGDNDHIRTGVTFDYEYRTVSFWFNADTIPSPVSARILTQDADTLEYGQFLAAIKDGGFHGDAGGSPENFVHDIDIDIWYLFHLVRNGPTVEYYVDGNLEYSDISGDYGSSSNPNENLVIGTGRKMNERFFDGTIDEIRITNNARISDWISTEYNNQNDPSSFIDIGLEETGP